MMAPEEIRGFKYLDWPNIAADMAERFKAVLEFAKDEKPLQEFFEANPVALLVGVDRPHRGWVLPRQALPKPAGGLWIPDFLVCDWTSIGPQWVMVELESPNARTITKRGLSQIFNHAYGQIRDYRNHLMQHADLVRAGGWPRLDANCKAVILIGRRMAYSDQDQERIASFRGENIEVSSYDRVADNIAQRVEMQRGTREAVKKKKSGL